MEAPQNTAGAAHAMELPSLSVFVYFLSERKLKQCPASQAFLFAGLENLFPNIEQECERSKIKVLPARPRFSISGAIWRPPPKNSLYKTMYTARHSLETFIRRLVLDHDAYPDIEFAAGTVIDVLADAADPSRLGKAVIRLDTGMVQEVPAVLIADCTGPRTGRCQMARSPRLRRGFGQPEALF
ncbi:hypothetical protein MIND_00379200 [Mycena indigotica]|uniref:Uncharacterized protein n=1 Tax=Mycena indigotica TaxID=2126181 RepID=A0A8H6T519_9AGAR|nr:uncharacterized protein MIND_00379200 [Mycena indigotica]KAF7310062.1 hypothetical protein MIND_00379200 [Mycena indigotica]